MKVNLNATLIFAGIFLVVGLSLLYSGIETCDVCPFRETIGAIFSFSPLNDAGMIFFAPILLAIIGGSVEITTIILYSIGYAILASVLGGVIYEKYRNEIRQPWMLYTILGTAPWLGLTLTGIIQNASNGFQVIQWILPLIATTIFYSYFLAGILVFASNEIMKKQWKKMNFKNKLVLFLAVTFIEYVAVRIAYATLFTSIID